MEGERNTTTQYRQSGESQELPPADQVEVKERGLLDTLLGRKKAPAEDQEKQEEALVSGMENVNVSEPETKHEGGGEKKESLLAKLHRTGSSSSSDEEEEVIDDNGEVVKRKKKGLKEKIKEKLPGGHKDHDVEAEHKPSSYTPAPVPTHKPYVPAPAPAYQEAGHSPYVQAPAPAHVHHQEAEHKPYVPPPAVETHAYKEEAHVPATAPAPVTTTHVHHDDNATVVQKVEETPEMGLLDKIKEKLPGGHKKPEDTTAATAPATHVDDVQSSPDGKDKEKKQGLLGRIMDKVPGYNKTPAEDHIESAATAGEHKTTSSS